MAKDPENYHQLLLRSLILRAFEAGRGFEANEATLGRSLDPFERGL